MNTDTFRPMRRAKIPVASVFRTMRVTMLTETRTFRNKATKRIDLIAPACTDERSCRPFSLTGRLRILFALSPLTRHRKSAPETIPGALNFVNLVPRTLSF